MHGGNGRTRIEYDQHGYSSGFHFGPGCSGSHDKLPKSIDVSMINASQKKSYTADGKIKRGRQGGGSGCLDEDWFFQINGNRSIQMSQCLIANQISFRRQR